MYMIKEMPKDERPRERLLNQGVKALSNEELLAILLRTGDKETSVIELSKKVLYHLHGLQDLKTMTVQELLTIKGIKLAKATTLIAAIELGRRLSREIKVTKYKIQSAFDIYDLVKSEISHLEQENFVVIYLNVKGEVIHKETIFIGTINQTLIHPREIFKPAIKILASAVVFCHNHPTGDASPSKADLDATEKLMEASQIVGIDLIDHVIIGKDEFYSIKSGKKTKL
ncbi:JAB domain-containing protein [Candidatus Falkowbacteria bacterium]|nr:JAB domain-containing protein [Candidatus Falkowbacteria bacterium]